MSTNNSQFSAFCPMCKDEIEFNSEILSVEEAFQGGLATVVIDSHGDPAHILTVYIDKQGKIRGTYPSMVTKVASTPKITKELKYNYIIDTSSDISIEEGEQIGLAMIPYYTVIDGETRKKYLKEISATEIIDLIQKNHNIKSAPITVNDFLDAFKQLDKTKETMVLTLSSNISKNYDNAKEAKYRLWEENPTLANSIYLIKTNAFGPALGEIVRNIIYLDINGSDRKQISKYINSIAKEHRTYFIMDNLQALWNSNRIKSLAEFYVQGKTIKPILLGNSSGSGTIRPYKGVETDLEGWKAICDLIKKDFSKKKFIGFIFHGLVEDKAYEFRDYLLNHFDIDKKSLHIISIGSMISILSGIEVMGIEIYPEI